MAAKKRPTGRERREAARRARQRKKQLRVAATGAAVSAAIVAGVLLFASGGSGTDETGTAAAPAFTLAKYEGGEAALSEYLGRPLVVTFMHTW